MKMLNKCDLQQTALNHSSNVDYDDFINIYRECTNEPYPFLNTNITFPSDHPLNFRKRLIDDIFKRKT